MLILILLILMFFILTILGYYVFSKYEDDPFLSITVASIITTILTLITLVCIMLIIDLPIAAINIVTYGIDIRKLDREIELVEKTNDQRVNDLVGSLTKYPALEKEIINDINPNNFAILGNIYPDLKSNEFFMREVDILTENINKIENLEREKIQRKSVAEKHALFFWPFIKIE